MNCEDIQTLLTQYFLGDLDEETAANVRAHLSDCGDCQVLARDIEPTLDLLRDALAGPSSAPERLSPHHRARLVREVRNPVRKAIRWVASYHPQLVTAAAAVAVLLVIAGLMLPALSKASSRARITRDRALFRPVRMERAYSPRAAVEVVIKDIEAMDDLVEVEELPEVEEEFEKLEDIPTVVDAVAPTESAEAFKRERYVSGEKDKSFVLRGVRTGKPLSHDALDVAAARPSIKAKPDQTVSWVAAGGEADGDGVRLNWEAEKPADAPPVASAGSGTVPGKDGRVVDWGWKVDEADGERDRKLGIGNKELKTREYKLMDAGRLTEQLARARGDKPGAGYAARLRQRKTGDFIGMVGAEGESKTERFFALGERPPRPPPSPPAPEKGQGVGPRGATRPVEERLHGVSPSITSDGPWSNGGRDLPRTVTQSLVPGSVDPQLSKSSQAPDTARRPAKPAPKPRPKIVPKRPAPSLHGPSVEHRRRLQREVAAADRVDDTGGAKKEAETLALAYEYTDSRDTAGTRVAGKAGEDLYAGAVEEGKKARKPLLGDIPLLGRLFKDKKAAVSGKEAVAADEPVTVVGGVVAAKPSADAPDEDPLPSVVAEVTPPTVTLEQEPPEVDSMSDADLDSFDNMAEATSPLKFRGLYAGRSAGGRASALGKYSGGLGTRTESAVVKSLRWLKEKQGDDGSWGNVEDTSLSLMAYLAHGETPGSDEFGDTTRKAMENLLSKQEDGRFSDDPDEHAKATLAVSEAYNLTRVPALKDAMDKAVGELVEDQRRREEGSVWEAQALGAAKKAGAETKHLKEAARDAVDRLEKSDDPSTALGLQLLGRAGDENAREKVARLREVEFDAESTEELEDMYVVHQARFHQGGRTWASWNRQAVPELMKRQNEDGSWSRPEGGESDEGDVRATALASLMNEVYYRFLPTYRPIDADEFAAETTEEVDEDIVITISEPEAEKVPEEEPQTGPRFRAEGVNPFFSTAERPFSTFAIDVDTAAYTLTRRYMTEGFLPPAEAVRTEEFVNFFDYDYVAPLRETFRVYTECAPSRFGRGLHLLKIGVKGRRLGREEKRVAVLTFLVDSSGSMNTPARIGLVKTSLAMLVDKLGPHDLVAIVQYDSRARLVLDHTPAAQKEKILAAIDGMQCGGSTNLEEGMEKAYSLAGRNFVGGGENRVLLLSDGVANLGSVAAEDILDKVAAYRKQGIYCSVFGFGTGTYDDTMLETLANKGDGAYAFIDSTDEARRIFVDDLAATLNTIAADVKIQVEFDTKRVKRYRQLGYENRQLTKEQFRDDTVDAGEVGSGQSVTALYEVELAAPPRRRLADPSLLATVRVRYRRTDSGAVEEIERPVRASEALPRFDEAPPRFKLAACVAEYAEILRASPFAAGSQYPDVAAVLRPVALDLSLDRRVQELAIMVEQSQGMSRGAE